MEVVGSTSIDPRLVELGETRGCKGSRAHSRGGASKDDSRRIATTDSGMPHMENVSGDVGIGEVNRRPARRNKVQIHAGERELKPAARARQGRGASGGTSPPKGTRQTRRVVVQEVGDAVEVRRQAILGLVSRVRGHVTQVTREVVGASSRRRGSSEQSSRGSLTGEAPLGKRSRGELLGTEDGRSPSERPEGLTKSPNVVGRNGEAREGHLPFGQGGRGRRQKAHDSAKSSIRVVKRNEGVAPHEFVRQPRRVMMERVSCVDTILHTARRPMSLGPSEP